MSLSCAAPQQAPLLTSTYSLQHLHLPTLTVRANLQQKCHMKPPKSCRLHAWPLTTQRKRDRPGAPLSAMLVPPAPQGLTGLIQHTAGSKTVLPAPAWPQGSQSSPCGFTQLPERATAANTAYMQVPVLGSSSALPQGHQPSQQEPGLLALARLLCLKWEAGDKHKQLLNLWAPSKPRLSPAGAVPGREHLDTSTCSSKPCAGHPGQNQGRWVQREDPPQHPESSRRCWEQQGRPCHMANPLCNSKLVGSCGFGCGQSGQQLPAAGPGLWKCL